MPVDDRLEQGSQKFPVVMRKGTMTVRIRRRAITGSRRTGGCAKKNYPRSVIFLFFRNSMAFTSLISVSLMITERMRMAMSKMI